MAKLKHGIFGTLSGKLGSVVSGTCKGIPYLRNAPKNTWEGSNHENTNCMTKPGV